MQQIGPYQVVGELGRGAAGVVYRVRDPRVAERELAIKVINLPPERAEQTLERFLREAEVLARVQHPGVVRVHGFERHPQGGYLIQELVEGELLEERIKRGALPAAEAARVVRGLADAVAAVHREGILHRDLKPSNVILRDGDPVLLDFGVARDLDAETLTKTGVLLGSPAYMSPEQAGGETVDSTTDVYSLGVILYELLSGVRPFRGSLMAVLKQVLDAQPVWPSALGVDVPPELEAVLRVAMAKVPAERYDSAEALREDLDRFLSEGPTHARTRAKPRSGKGGLWGGVALALLVALAAALVWLKPWAHTPAPAEPAQATSSSPKDSAEPAPVDPLLWTLQAGDTFRVQLTFDERSTGQVRMDAILEAVVERIEDETAHLVLKVPTISVHFGLFMHGRDDAQLDRPARDDTPLSDLVQTSMAPFHCALKLRTGAAVLSGLDVIQKRIRDQPEAIAEIEKPYLLLDDVDVNPNLAGNLCKIFSNEYLGASMDSLTHVQRPGWKESHSGQSYTFSGQEPQPLLWFVQLGGAGARGAVRLEGSATYTQGRLTSAVMEQAYRDTPDYTTRWTWTLLDDSAPETRSE